jgi:DNA-binding LacI/PurR family transcriptional regulator
MFASAEIAELDYRPNLAARRLATKRSSVTGMVGIKMTYYGTGLLSAES